MASSWRLGETLQHVIQSCTPMRVHSAKSITPFLVHHNNDLMINTCPKLFLPWTDLKKARSVAKLAIKMLTVKSVKKKSGQYQKSRVNFIAI